MTMPNGVDAMNRGCFLGCLASGQLDHKQGNEFVLRRAGN